MSAYRNAAPAARLPDRCELPLRALPAASQERLRALAAKTDSARRLDRATPTSAALLLVAGLLPLAVVLAMTAGWAIQTGREVRFDHRPPWVDTELWLVSASGALAALLLAAGLATLARARRSPLGSFWYAHPAYLLDCAYDRVVAYPLASFALRELSGPALDLTFGEEDVRLVFDAPADAAAFLRVLTRDAAEAARQIERGTPDGIPEAELIPPELLHRQERPPPWQHPWAIPIAAATIAGLAARVGLPRAHEAIAAAALLGECDRDLAGCATYLTLYPEGARLAETDDRLFARAGSPADFARYRVLLPRGRHAAEVKTKLGAAYDELSTKYRGWASPAAHPEAPAGIAAMVRSLEALRDAKSHTLYMRVSGHADLARAAIVKSLYPKDTFADPGMYLAAPWHHESVAKVVDGAITAVIGRDAIGIELLPGHAPPPEGAAAVLDVDYMLTPGVNRYEFQRAGKLKLSESYYELVASWTLTFRWPGQPDVEPITLHLSSAPGERVTGVGDGVDDRYGMMELGCIQNLDAELRHALGERAAPAP